MANGWPHQVSVGWWLSRLTVVYYRYSLIRSMWTNGHSRKQRFAFPYKNSQVPHVLCHAKDNIWHIRKKSVCVHGLQSAFCTNRIGIAVFVRGSLKSGPKYWSSKKMLVRLSWPPWLIRGLCVEELTRKSTMIGQWLLYTNWRRTQMRGIPTWLSLMLFRVVTACVEMNSLRVP